VEPDTDRSPRPPITVLPPSPSVFGDAVLRAMARFLNAGWREHGGMNRGKEIEAVFLKPLGLAAGQPYCAATLAAAIRSAEAETGLRSPVRGSAGALATMAQFKAAGLWTPIRDVTPAHLVPGAALISSRGEPTAAQGHVAVILEPVGEHSVGCIEGNADRVIEPISGEIYAVCQTERRLDDPRLLGVGRWT